MSELDLDHVHYLAAADSNHEYSIEDVRALAKEVLRHRSGEQTRHRQTDIVNAIYAAAVQVCEEREFQRGGKVGNGHHMAQEIAAAAEQDLVRRGIFGAAELHKEQPG